MAPSRVSECAMSLVSVISSSEGRSLCNATSVAVALAGTRAPFAKLGKLHSCIINWEAERQGSSQNVKFDD